MTQGYLFALVTVLQFWNIKSNFICPGDEWNILGSRCYQAITYDNPEGTDRSWTTARQFCRDIGGDLVSINQPAEDATVEVLRKRAGIRDDCYYWIGLTDLRKEGQFEWVDRQILQPGEANWQTGQPDSSNPTNSLADIEDYVIASGTWKWSDVGNDWTATINGKPEPTGFICEAPAIFLTERGPPGLKGAPGQGGLMGDPGVQGSPGEPGPMGAQGPRGRTGLDGTRGLSGSKGRSGEVGTRGAEGVTGAPGVRGEMGPIGRQGSTGSAGSPGSKGFSGDLGPIGFQGPTGDKGLTGDKGSFGDSGGKGVKGEKGEGGLVGVQGGVGRKGPSGDRGNKGGKGDLGARGPQGVRGLGGDLGPVGPQGTKGEKGELGQGGRLGPSGFKGQKGDLGEAGFKGLPGTLGPRGPHGNRGSPGEAGVKGQDGSRGPSGFRGSGGGKGGKGEKGSAGVKGLAGDRGLDGRDGVNGLNGNKGANGEIGDKGLIGDGGPDGQAGGVGIPGPPGPPGDQSSGPGDSRILPAGRTALTSPRTPYINVTLFCAGLGPGLYAHPLHCWQFVACGLAFKGNREFSCVGGRAFHPVARTCVFDPTCVFGVPSQRAFNLTQAAQALRQNALSAEADEDLLKVNKGFTVYTGVTVSLMAVVAVLAVLVVRLYVRRPAASRSPLSAGRGCSDSSGSDLMASTSFSKLPAHY